MQQSGGALTSADPYLFAALLVCAAGYTEGGRRRVMPGWQVIGWALALCLPVTVPMAAVALSYEPVHWTAHGVTGLLWVAIGSQFLGLVVWYRGMAGDRRPAGEPIPAGAAAADAGVVGTSPRRST
ncbi:DMT family transporter OS=Streptomyces tendae OX=1932 GN=GUR47_33420 PE=4 SV=1 [Streptomyces tendae]